MSENAREDLLYFAQVHCNTTAFLFSFCFLLALNEANPLPSISNYKESFGKYHLSEKGIFCIDYGVDEYNIYQCLTSLNCHYELTQDFKMGVEVSFDVMENLAKVHLSA